ncbi:MAG: hypothetical protein ABWY19_06775 [Marmoricola sp.]
MRRLFASVAATAAETQAERSGDQVVPHANVVMDRGFDVPGTPAQVWPWLVQLGKERGGWYLPRRVERVVPPARRATRVVDPRWQGLAVGERIPDYGGPEEYFEAVEVEPPGPAGAHLVYRSQRGRVQVSWAITLTPTGAGTRVHLRLRLGEVRRVRLAESLGELVDALSIAGMAAGLRERVGEPTDLS